MQQDCLIDTQKNSCLTGIELMTLPENQILQITTHCDFLDLCRLNTSCKSMNELLCRNSCLTFAYNNALIASAQQKDPILFTRLWDFKHEQTDETTIRQQMNIYRGKIWKNEEKKQAQIKFNDNVLMQAAQSGDLTKVQIALANGSDINQTYQTRSSYHPKHSALQIACNNKHNNIVAMLLQKNATPDGCIEIAIDQLNLELLNLLLAHINLKNYGTKRERGKLLYTLIKRHINNEESYTALTEIVKILVQKNNTINILCGDSKETTLGYLIDQADFKIVAMQEILKIFIDNGADITLYDEGGNNALHKAFTKKNYFSNVTLDTLLSLMPSSQLTYRQKISIFWNRYNTFISAGTAITLLFLYPIQVIATLGTLLVFGITLHEPILGLIIAIIFISYAAEPNKNNQGNCTN